MINSIDTRVELIQVLNFFVRGMESDSITKKYRLRPSIETQSSESSRSKLSVGVETEENAGEREINYVGGDTISQQSSNPTTIKKRQGHFPQRKTEADDSEYDNVRYAFLQKPVHESYQPQSEEECSNSDICLDKPPLGQQSIQESPIINHHYGVQSIDSRDGPSTTTNQGKKRLNLYNQIHLLTQLPPDAITTAEDIFTTPMTFEEHEVHVATKHSTQKLNPEFERSWKLYSDHCHAKNRNQM